MSGNGEEAVGIDGRLAMLGRDDDGGRLEEVLILKCTDHLADGRIDEFDFGRHAGSRIARGIRIPALDAVLDQLLPNAYGLKVHPKNRGNRRPASAKVGL